MAKKNKQKPAIHNKRRNKIRLHNEGTHSLIVWGLVVLFILSLCYMYGQQLSWGVYAIAVPVIVTYGCLVNFYRCPIRMYTGPTTNAVVAPADGKVVVIEEVDEHEYFHDRRIMVSIFMSPLNVHANWIPCEGTIIKVAHHDGKTMKAWLPKASTENERSMVVIRTPQGKEVMARQIAGAMARRIVTYSKAGEQCFVDDHMGFIKLGSRVDVYLPLDSEILVSLNQKTVGDETLIARLK